MKYTLLIDQRTIAEKFPQLDLKDAALLAFLGDAFNSPRLYQATIEGRRYTWISHSMVIEQMPLLDLKNGDAVQKRLKRLREAGLISSRMIGDTKIGHAPGHLWDALTGLTPPDESAAPPGSKCGPPPDESAGDKTINDKTIKLTPPTPKGERESPEFQKIPAPPSERKATASKAKSRDHEGPHLYPVEFQESLPFCQALADYFRGRREKRQAATPTAAELIRKKLIACGLDKATETLQISAANGWTGIFPERQTPGSKPQSGKDEPPLALW